MRLTIQNHALTVEIDTLGAQLASIRAPDGTEYLWQGNPEIWARRAPMLFPVIGRLRDSAYLLDGVPYTIPQHGFARDMEFQVSGQTGQSLSLSISDTEATRAVYPFAFSLTVTYSLEGNTLVKAHRVENRSDQEMLFELGGHDGFRAPIEPGVPMSAYRIVLPQPSVRLYGMDDPSIPVTCASSPGPPSRTPPLWAGSWGTRRASAAWPPAGARPSPTPPPSTDRKEDCYEA